MAEFKATDNGDVAAKLDLRRHFLSAYHADKPARVLDCCMGEGVLWSILRREFEVESYWGIDVKAKPGRMRVDSSRVLATPDLEVDVIDIDTYGSPWAHWDALVENVQRPVTVFMTWGQTYLSAPNRRSLLALGLTFGIPRSPGFGRSLHGLSVSASIYAAESLGLRVVEAKRAENNVNMTAYFGVRIEPA